jgi:hypothetical protein
MKNLKMKSINSGLIALFFAVIFMACESTPEVTPQADILPDRFGVNIPNSLSNNTLPGGRVTSGRVANGRTTGDVVEGSDVYEHLGLFINVGESAADIVEEIINSIRRHQIDKAMTVTYESEEDQRVKNVVIVEGAEYEGEAYEFMLTMTDAESESNVDGGKGLQIFWNRNPVKGVALIKPYNIDRLHDADAGEAAFRIDYNSMGDTDYEATMMVSIADLTLEEPEVDLYSMRSLKMFVGKRGSKIDVLGNSNHPNAQFFTNDTGFNWAFVASGDENSDLGIAEVGLPPSNLDETSRTVLLEEYSIKNVFTDQITQVWPDIDQTMLDEYLKNTAGPGYFNADGFVAGGTSPSAEWDALEARIEVLAPYNPVEIANLEIKFQ